MPTGTEALCSSVLQEKTATKPKVVCGKPLIELEVEPGQFKAGFYAKVCPSCDQITAQDPHKSAMTRKG